MKLELLHYITLYVIYLLDYIRRSISSLKSFLIFEKHLKIQLGIFRELIGNKSIIVNTIALLEKWSHQILNGGLVTLMNLRLQKWSNYLAAHQEFLLVCKIYRVLNRKISLRYTLIADDLYGLPFPWFVTGLYVEFWLTK